MVRFVGGPTPLLLGTGIFAPPRVDRRPRRSPSQLGHPARREAPRSMYLARFGRQAARVARTPADLRW
jgi:hypothetical protein